jgi:hypothetical protein
MLPAALQLWMAVNITQHKKAVLKSTAYAIRHEK